MTEDDIVFPPKNSTLDGYRRGYDAARHVLYPAMKRTGVDRVGPTGEERTFHSLRLHVRADRARERREHRVALAAARAQLDGRHAERVRHWSTKAEEAEIAKLDAALEAKGMPL